MSAPALLPRTLLPLLLCLVLLGGGLTISTYRLAHIGQRLSETWAWRDQLTRALQSVEDRHVRSMRRSREALLTRDTEHAIAMLEGSGAQYVADFKRLLQAVQLQLKPFAGDAAPQRLQRQLQRLGEEAARLAPLFVSLRQALATRQPPTTHTAPLYAAQTALEHADRSMTTLLNITNEMVRSMATAELLRVRLQHTVAPAGSGWLLLLLVGMSLAYSARPLWRLQAFSQQFNGLLPARFAAQPSAQRPVPLTRAEQQLQAGCQAWAEHTQALTDSLEERQRELARTLLLQRRAEHELALWRLYNDNLVNSLRSAIVVTDAKGSLTAINRTARALLHMDDKILAQPMHSMPLFQAILAQQPALLTQLEVAASQRQALRFTALPYALSSTSEVPNLRLDVSIAPYQDESGAVRGWLFVADDVTDAVRTKHQLLQAERLAAVGRLSAQVAHEIRNPLSAIGLNAELLEEEFGQALQGKAGIEARGLLRAIGNEIERLTEVTEAYLQLARLPHPQRRLVDINAVINDLFNMLHSELKNHRIAVELDLASPAPQVQLDAGQLRQALLNLVRNSREAMPQGGQLRVVTRAAAHSMTICLEDNGCGIPATVLPRVFEPFFSTKPYGSGLGLSLTQHIVHEHGGRLELLPSTLQRPPKAANSPSNAAAGTHVRITFAA